MDCPMNSTAGEKKIITARVSLSPRFGDSAAPVSIDSKPEVLKKPKLEESVEVEVSTKEVDGWMISDDEDVLHEMTDEEMAEYCKWVNESDTNMYILKFIIVKNMHSSNIMQNEKKNYTLHKIVKANVSGCAGVIYYITFQAEDLDKVGQVRDGDQGAENVGPAGGPIVEFEAKVFLRVPNEQRICKMEMMLFRQKGAKVIEKGSKVLEGGCC